MNLEDYKPESGDTEKTVIDLARKRRKLCIDAESDTRKEAEDDIRFAKGDQWPAEIRTTRESEQNNQPCLTVNKTGQYVRQVVNDSRQNSPAVRVFPVGGGSDQETAKVMNGLMRDIQQRTDADIAYDTAIESAARCGEGFFRLIARYESDEGFDQEIAFSRIRNFASCHLDPACQDPAGADALYGFVDQWLDQDEVKEQYGVDAIAGIDTHGLGEHAPNWILGESMLVTEYYSIERDQKRTLVMLKTGAQVILEELADEPAEGDIVAVREVRVTRCVWRKMTGTKILEKTIWPCKYIPLFRVIGDEFEVDGKVFYQGLIRPMKDSQRMYNYWMTAATEKGALETKAPYIGAIGQFDGVEQDWRNANRVPLAYLEYNPVDVEGRPLPPPARSQASFSGQVDVAMAERSSDDMKSTAGMYDASLGARSNEQSGKAIIARERQSDTGTFHYVDNQARAIRHCGRVLAEVLPKIYNSERIVRILGEDDSEEMVMINGTESKGEKKGTPINDITIGRYDVRVSVGPSYSTRRLESADSMMQFIQAVPQAGEAIMDLLAKTMDWPGSDEIAERLRKMVPPQLLETGEESDEGFTPAQVEAMINEAVGNLQQQFEASLAERDMQVKEVKAAADVASKMGPTEEKMREMVGGMLAEFVQQMGSGVESAT
jgi:hypothetical protein